MTAPAVLYGPTLRSPGGLYALGHQIDALDVHPILAIIPPDVALPSNLKDVEVLRVSGHLQGHKTLCSIRRNNPGLVVVAVQNPILPTRCDISIIQNYLAAHPIRGVRFGFSLRRAAYVAAITVLTMAQIALSRRVVVLTRDVPSLWPRLAPMTVRPNVVAAAPYDGARARMIAVVGSWEAFRRIDLIIRAFDVARLGQSGWTLEILARASDARHEEWCRRLAAQTGAVIVHRGHVRAWPLLRRASVCAFASAVEGSSVAYLEASALGAVLVARDVPHYRDSTPAGRVVHWVSGDEAVDWCGALRRAALDAEHRFTLCGPSPSDARSARDDLH